MAKFGRRDVPMNLIVGADEAQVAHLEIDTSSTRTPAPPLAEACSSVCSRRFGLPLVVLGAELTWMGTRTVERLRDPGHNMPGSPSS